MANTKTKLPAIGTLIARVEIPGFRYRVTSHSASVSGVARCLPFRAQGREIHIEQINGMLIGDGSVWTVCS